MAWQQGWGLEKGQKILTPKVKLTKSDELDKNNLEKIQRKLDIFIANKIETLMPGLVSLANSHEFSGRLRDLPIFL